MITSQQIQHGGDGRHFENPCIAIAQP